MLRLPDLSPPPRYMTEDLVSERIYTKELMKHARPLRLRARHYYMHDKLRNTITVLAGSALDLWAIESINLWL